MLCARRSTRCGVVFLFLFHAPSQVHRKGDLGDEADGMKRKRRRRLQRVPEAFAGVLMMSTLDSYVPRVSNVCFLQNVVFLFSETG